MYEKHVNVRFVIFFLHRNFIFKRNMTQHYKYALCTVFDIVAINIQTFVIACNQFEETTFVKLCVLRCKELSHYLLPASALFWKSHLENVAFNEQVKVRLGKIRAKRLVIQSLSSQTMHFMLLEPCCVMFYVVI